MKRRSGHYRCCRCDAVVRETRRDGERFGASGCQQCGAPPWDTDPVRLTTCMNSECVSPRHNVKLCAHVFES